MNTYNSEDYISQFVELMDSWRSCWSSCSSGCGGCYGDDDDDLFGQICKQNYSGGCSGDCSQECEEECDNCSCVKSKKSNFKSIQDDGCFCRNPKCNDFVPMAEPDGDDGKVLCWKCANGY